MAIVIACGFSTRAEQAIRTELPFPDLQGFVTLRCDFHLHTVFSDGNVWPPIRVEEAWRTGLDVIALTDHIEYQPHKGDVPTKHGRSYELARPSAASLGIILLRAAEITRGEPPGHLNALFLTNVAAIDTPDYRVAVSNAAAQGAFLFWNHPGWKQPDRKSVWYEEQGEFLKNGRLHGIEVVNGNEYDPIAHGWAVEKKLALIGNSDAHDPIGFDYNHGKGELRPVTLVFASERSESALREALFARRTAVFSQGRIFGAAEFLEPLFHGSIKVLNPGIRLKGKSRAVVQIRNTSPADFHLRLNSKLPELDVPSRVILHAGAVSLLRVECVSDRVLGKQVIPIYCRVTNLLVAPGKPLATHLTFAIEYEAPAKVAN